MRARFLLARIPVVSLCVSLACGAGGSPAGDHGLAGDVAVPPDPGDAASPDEATGPRDDAVPPDLDDLPAPPADLLDVATDDPGPGDDLAVDPGADPAAPDAASDAAADPGLPDLPADPGGVDAGDACPHPCEEGRHPVILVHGINGSSQDFATMIGRLKADGWPDDWIFPFDAKDPKWGCNVDNAAALKALAEKAMAATCRSRVDVVAHSMGSIGSRYWIKNLGGQDVVNTYVTLGGMHHGLSSPCWAPDFLGVCVWKELCQTGAFIAQLNADPATPGKLHWVSMYGTADETVPNASSHLDGAENIAFEGVEHSGANGLQEVEAVYLEVRRVLGYPCW